MRVSFFFSFPLLPDRDHYDDDYVYDDVDVDAEDEVFLSLFKAILHLGRRTKVDQRPRDKI